MEKDNVLIDAQYKTAANRNRKRKGSPLKTLLKWVCCILLETVVLLLVTAYVFLFILAKGPSETAGKQFARSVKETSAIGFLADIYFSDEELEEMLSSGEAEFEATDTNLIAIDETVDHSTQPDAWGLIDEDGDGIIIDPVKGEGYAGYMMVVLDPSRVILATYPDKYGGKGYTVEEYVKKFGAVAGINAGAFEDVGGAGDGSTPEGLVVYKGKCYFGGVKQGFAGIDADGILHVGIQNSKEAVENNIQYGASYGPVLVQNGVMMDESTLESGLNPRTAIGQRSDGAFLLLVIDGRQVISLGATYQDEAEIMMRYGAVNAVNMDGGSSSMMWYNDGYINNCASVIGIREIPTAFVVMPQGWKN